MDCCASFKVFKVCHFYFVPRDLDQGGELPKQNTDQRPVKMQSDERKWKTERAVLFKCEELKS